MTKTVDLVAGQKFGDVEVVRKHHTKIVYYGKRKVTKDFYLCRCKCGKEFVAYKHNLTRNVDIIARLPTNCHYDLSVVLRLLQIRSKT